MANTDPVDVDRWVDERMAALGSGTWEPDTASGLAAVESREALQRQSQRRRLRWTAAAVAATTVAIALPGTRAIGARCVEACVSATKNVTQQLWRSDGPAATAPRVAGTAIGDL